MEGLVERTVMHILSRLNVDSAGRLRVGDCTLTSGTVTTLTNLTNWGLHTATAKSQWESQMAYQMGFRRNLVVT